MENENYNIYKELESSHIENRDYPFINDKGIVLGEMGKAGNCRCFVKEEFDIKKMSDGLYVLKVTNDNVKYWHGGNVSKLEKEFI